MRNFLFLTTANFATNPRLVKEVKLAMEMPGKVTVIMFRLGNWSDAKGDEIVRELRERGELTIFYCDATRTSWFPWLLWGMAEKVARLLYPFIQGSVLLSALASSRRSFQMIKKVYSIKPDLICAHNLGALYPAWRLSKKWKVPFVFDVEDYHPGEFIRFDAVHEKKRREFLMKKLLPQAAAITSASPLIGEYTMKLIGGHPNHQVILNSFPQKEFIEPPNHQITKSPNQLNLVWFSQKISFGRGLEQLFEAINLLIEEQNSAIEFFSLAIIGDLEPDFDTKVIVPFKSGIFAKRLQIIPPMSQLELHRSLALYDIGLALEPGKDLNNLLAVSNKILAYTQAGLYILATDTLAQKQFMQEHEGFGLLCGQTPEGMRDGLATIVRKMEIVISQKKVRIEKATTLAWEKETEKLKSSINHILDEKINKQLA